ncbi:MAG: phosphatase PAP2 family protein [Ruminococcaceae bacterium]|nr:phosphatase PAP2 family protein [Oscillospiraceae bacterium]
MFSAFLSFEEFFYNIAHSLHQTAADSILTPIATVASFLGDNGYIWIALALILLLFKKTRKIGVIVAGALVLDVIVVNGLLKILIDRPRPWVGGEFDFITKEYVGQRLVSIPADSSFPSGHTASSFAAAVALILALPKNKKAWCIPALILAFIIAASRIYVCVHYPTDVFAGIIIGSIIGVVAYFIAKAIYKWLEKSGKLPKINQILIGEKWGI